MSEQQATNAEATTTEATTGNEGQVATVTPNDVAANTQPEPSGETAQETFDREYVEKLRKENATYRTKAKEYSQQVSETAEAKEAEKNELIQQIGKALGLVEDTQDPKALLDAATQREQEAAAERDKLAQELNQFRQQNAVQAAAPAGVDTDLLNAVLSANKALDQLDPTADDYAQQVNAAVNAVIEKHPSLRTQAVPHASGVDPTNTNTGAQKTLTREDLNDMSAEDINKAVREGRLNHLLGGK